MGFSVPGTPPWGIPNISKSRFSISYKHSLCGVTVGMLVLHLRGLGVDSHLGQLIKQFKFFNWNLDYVCFSQLEVTRKADQFAV